MRIWLVAAVLALGAPAAVAQQFRQKDFDAYVRRGLQTLRVPGVAVAVVKDGKLVFAQGYGVRTLGDTGRVDAHTLFQIASNTKAFTTAALAMLVDEGKLAWDDPVTKYLPDFQLYDPYVTREFTLRDLVTHRSGLGLGAGDLLWFHSSYGRAEIIHRIRAAKPASSFRSRYAYDNVLYIAAGEIVPAVTGKSWDDFIKERILTPLGMTESGTSIAFLSSTSDVAAPHGVERGQLQVVPRDSIDNTGPAGGIVSNVSDMAKWLLCRLDSGRYAGGRLFSERQARVMWAGQTILPIGDPPPPLAALRPSFSEYGLGWFLRDYRGRKVVAHTGGLAGMTSQVMLVPGERLGVHEPLGERERAGRTAFDRVTRQGERRSREADERDVWGQRPRHGADRVQHVRQIGHRVHWRELEHLGRLPDRSRDLGTLPGREREAEAQRLERQQDIGEQDGGVDAEAIDRLQGDLGGQLRLVTELQQRVLLPQRAIFR